MWSLSHTIMRSALSKILLSIVALSLIVSGCAVGGAGSGVRGGEGRGGSATVYISSCLILCNELRHAAENKSVPITMEQESEIVSRATASQSKVRGARVLWVDDNPENNDGERNFLNQTGILIDIARSTSDAISRIENKHYDLVISDMWRGLDPWAGSHLLEKIKENQKEIPIIFYTDRNYDKPSGAFGITTRPDALIGLVLKSLEINYRPARSLTSISTIRKLDTLEWLK